MTTSLPDNRFSQAINAFLELERENKLHDLRIDDVAIWRLVRAEFFMKSVQLSGIHEKRESGRISLFKRIVIKMRSLVSNNSGIAKSSLRDQLLSAASRLSIIPNFLASQVTKFGGTRKDVLILGFQRKMPNNLRLTLPVEEAYQGKAIRIDKPYAGALSADRIDPKILETAAKFRSVDLSISKIDACAEKLSHLLKMPEAFCANILRKRTEEFLALKEVYAALLARLNIQRVYLCWNKHYYALLAASQELGIETSEFQHGIICRYHIQYTHGTDHRVPYFPDTLLSFGPDWHKITDLPDQCEMLPVGSELIHHMMEKHQSVRKEQNLVAVFSQQIIGTSLFKFIVETARLRPDLSFVIKLHPAERYQDLTIYVDGEIPSNITIADRSEDSYKLMARATFQMGVSSTTLMEGLMFGNQVIVVPFATWEYMEHFIKNDQMVKVTTPTEAAKELELDDTPPIDMSGFFSSPDNSLFSKSAQQ